MNDNYMIKEALNDQHCVDMSTKHRGAVIRVMHVRIEQEYAITGQN